MFGVSIPELIVIFVVLLIVVGPDKLPEIAHTFGKLMGQFKKNSDSLRREFYNSTYKPMEEAQRGIDSVKRELRSMKDVAIKEMLAPPVKHDPQCPDCPPTKDASTTEQTSQKKEGI